MMMNNVPVHFTVLINIGLALIPFILAFILFKLSTKRNLLWWLLCAVFIAFLPNSAYVLTDIIHFVAAIKSPKISLSYLLLVLIPFYLFYMFVCFEFYVLSISWAHKYLQQQAWFTFASIFIPTIHFLCAIGVYLGRFQRLESADIARHPWLVFQDIAIDLTHKKSLFIIIGLFIGYYLFYQLLNRFNLWCRDKYKERFDL